MRTVELRGAAIRKAWSVPGLLGAGRGGVARRLLTVLLLAAGVAHAATYSLPAAIGSGPFINCSLLSGTTYSCSGSVSIGNNDTVSFSSAMTLQVAGNFTVANNSTLNGNGHAVTVSAGGNITLGNANTSSVNYTAAGNVTVGNGASVSGDITAGGNVTIGNGGTINGDISAGGSLSLGSGTSVFGYCTPGHASCVGSGLLGEYRFDECSQYTGAAGEVLDTRGTYPGTPLGGLQNAAAGQIERHADFSAGSRHVRLTSGPALTNWTISVWFKTPFAGSATHSSRYYVLGSVNVRGDFLYLDRNSGGGAYRWGVYDQNGGISNGSFRFSTLADGWHHMALVGSGSTTSLYINGVYRDRVNRKTSGTAGYLGASVDDVGRSSGQSFGTPLDEFKIFSAPLTATQISQLYSNELGGRNWDGSTRGAACAAFNHLRIEHTGSGVTCTPTTLTLRACADAACSAPFAGGVAGTLTATGTPAVNWVGGAGFSIPAGSGSVTKNVQVTTAGTVSWSATGLIPAAPGATRCFVGATESCNFTASAVGCAANFNACEPNIPQCTPVVPPLAYAALYTKLAGVAFSLEGVALRADGTLETGFSGSVDVDLLANNVNTVVSLGATCPPISPDTVVISLGNATFAGGRAPISNISIANAYRDVRMRFTCSAAVCGNTITACSSDNFAVRPQAFTVTANLGGPALKAGHNFLLSAASGVPAGYTGTPVLDPAQVRDHNGAAAGLLGGNFAAATGSSASGTFQYHDVGTIALLANAVTDGSHTAVDQANGDCIVGSAGNTLTAGRYGCMIGSAAAGPFGRFYPDHFSYAATLTPANPGGFSYMNQPALDIDLSLEARSSNGTVTARYTTGYSALGTFSITGDNAGAAVSVARLSPPLPAFTWTNGRYVANSATTAFTRAVVPDGPFDSFALRANILSEPDGVAISGPSLSNATRIRFGRFRLINHHGSELLRARVEYRAEYWDGNRWALNVLDSSAPVAVANLASGGLTATALTGLSGGSGFVTFDTAPAGSYDIAFNLNAAGANTACVATAGGVPANRPWLQGYWSAPAHCGGVAAWAQDPGARVRLGSPRAPYIYLRERY